MTLCVLMFAIAGGALAKQHVRRTAINRVRAISTCLQPFPAGSFFDDRRLAESREWYCGFYSDLAYQYSFSG